MRMLCIRDDLLVDDKVILELKAVENILPVFEVQLLNYLKATGIEVGLLLNFGPKLQFKRKVFSVNHNFHKKSASSIQVLIHEKI